MMETIAKRLFAAEHDYQRVKDELEEILDNQKASYENMGFDSYDCSIELYDVPTDFRASPELQQALKDAGFIKLFVNHVDKWETHYSLLTDTSSAGWRVSYPHKRQDGMPGIQVEEICVSWPKEWFETGYAVVIKKD